MALRNFLNHSDSTPNKRHIPSQEIYYEYDLDVLFGSDMPKVIIKKGGHKSSENSREICPNFGDGLIARLKKVLNCVKGGKQEKKNETVVKEIVKKNNEENLISIAAGAICEEDEFIFFFKFNHEHFVFSIFFDTKELQMTSTTETKKNFDSSKKVFEDLTKTFLKKTPLENKNEKIEDFLPDNVAKELANNPINVGVKRPREDDDAGYNECFPELDLPSLEDLKNYREKHGISIKEAAMKSYADKKHHEQKKTKNKKKHMENEAIKIKQVLFKSFCLDFCLDDARKRSTNRLICFLIKNLTYISIEAYTFKNIYLYF